MKVKWIQTLVWFDGPQIFLMKGPSNYFVAVAVDDDWNYFVAEVTPTKWKSYSNNKLGLQKMFLTAERYWMVAASLGNQLQEKPNLTFL